jgi:hypothetical protein
MTAVKLICFKINLRLGGGRSKSNRGPHATHEPPVGIAGLDNVGSFTSQNPTGLHGLTQG